MSTKDIVAQEILAHEAIYKIAKLLDQFCDGLKAVQLLDLVRAFPVVFSPLFTYSGDIDGREVAESLFVDEETELTRQNEIVMDFLHKYLLKCTNEGEKPYYFFVGFCDYEWFSELERFLLFATGKMTVSKVQVDFLQDSDAISAHTCSSLIVFPRNAMFGSFDEFCTAFTAVVSAKLNFNIV
jgi:hypothetical protein